MTEKQYDVVVIGAGSGGLTAAVGFSKVGKKVLLVEREHMGGECTNTGCIPSKALLHHAKEYHQAKKIAGGNPESDSTLEAFRSNAFSYVQTKVAEILAKEQPADFKKLGIDVVMGEAAFQDKCSVRVGDKVHGFKIAVVATGSSPRLLQVPGLDQKDVLTNQNIFNLKDVPARLLIIGGGPIGMEMAQAFALLGSKVTVAERGERFARLEDPAVAAIITKKFTDLGITIILNADITAIENKQALLNIKDQSFPKRIAYDKILIAIGRTPNFPPGLEAAGIESCPQCLCVDSQYRTSNKYVYALGDVTQRLKFTHTADDIARQIVKRVVSRGLLRVNKRKAVPKVTYTSPEIAQVGLSNAEAAAKYTEKEVMRVEVPFTENDRAHTDDIKDGVLVVLVRRLNGQILGAHIAGPAAGELITVLTLAIEQKISMWKLQKLIFAYPTYSLIIKKAADQFFARQITDLKTDLKNLIIKHAPKIIAAIFWIILIYNFQHYKISNDLSYQDIAFELLEFFTSTMWGPLVYIILYAIRPLIFFPATLLTALSGALFGFWWGIIYTILGENASANFAYWIGRFFGKDLKLEDSIIGNWVEALRKQPFGTVLFMRLFYVPFDLTNYGSGILKVPWVSYALATVIGIMPGLTTFVALGAAVDIKEFQMNGLSFDALDPKFLALSFVIFVGSIFISKILKKWHAAKD